MGAGHRAGAHSIQIMKADRGDRGQQLPPASSQAVPRLQDQVPAAPPGPSLPAQATLNHQEDQYILLDAGPPCPLVYPNKLLRKTGGGKKRKEKKEKGVNIQLWPFEIGFLCSKNKIV